MENERKLDAQEIFDRMLKKWLGEVRTSCTPPNCLFVAAVLLLGLTNDCTVLVPSEAVEQEDGETLLYPLKFFDRENRFAWGIQTEPDGQEYELAQWRLRSLFSAVLDDEELKGIAIDPASAAFTIPKSFLYEAEYLFKAGMREALADGEGWTEWDGGEEDEEEEEEEE